MEEKFSKIQITNNQTDKDRIYSASDGCHLHYFCPSTTNTIISIIQENNDGERITIAVLFNHSITSLTHI